MKTLGIIVSGVVGLLLIVWAVMYIMAYRAVLKAIPKPKDVIKDTVNTASPGDPDSAAFGGRMTNTHPAMQAPVNKTIGGVHCRIVGYRAGNQEPIYDCAGVLKDGKGNPV